MASRSASPTIFLYMGSLTLLVSIVRTDHYLVGIPVSYMLKNQLHATATEVAMFLLLTGIPIYIAVIFGLARDLWNPFGWRDRGLFLIFAPASAVAFLWMAFSPLSYLGLLSGVVFAALSLQFVVAAQSGLISLVGQEELMTGRLSSLWTVADQLPMCAAAIAAGYLTGHFSPRSFFLLMAALSLLLTWYAFWKPAAIFTDLYQAPQARGSNLAGDIKRLVRHRAIYPALLIIGLWFFVPGTGTPLQFYLTNQLHLSDSVYANFRAILSISNIPGMFLYGVLCRRFSLKKMLWWGTAIATPGLIPLLFIHSASLALLAATMSLSWGFAWAAYIDLAIRSCPPGLQGTMMMLVAGATVLLTNAGDLFGAKLYSSSTTHGFLYCVLAATVTTGLILPAILLVPRQLIATSDGEPSRAIESGRLEELGAT
jgi:MFS family permease